jgi:hypothetical protein
MRRYFLALGFALMLVGCANTAISPLARRPDTGGGGPYDFPKPGYGATYSG